MSFWDDYLKAPPFEVMSMFPGDPSDTHIVLWRGHEDFDVKELWNFDAGIHWHGRPPSLPNFVKYGGETLCGLGVESGRNMYGVRWWAFDDHIGESGRDPALLDMHGVTCMVCRRKLMYGIGQIIRRLTQLRDAVGEDYVQKRPLVHGKKVISHNNLGGGITSEAYQRRCTAANEEVNPQLADDVEEFDRITCPDCIANIQADTAYGRARKQSAKEGTPEVG